jgi:hypothetical protein
MKNFNPNKIEELKNLEDWEIKSLTSAFNRALFNGTTLKELLKLSKFWSERLGVQYRDEKSIWVHIRAMERQGMKFEQNGETLKLRSVGRWHPRAN